MLYVIIVRSWLGSEKGGKVKDVGDGAQETDCGNKRRTDRQNMVYANI